MKTNDLLYEVSLLDLSSDNIKIIIKNTPLVSFSRFISNFEPCDILVSFPSFFRSEFEKVRSQVLAMAQRVPISSAKMVFNKRYVIGYGVKKSIPHKVELASSKDWLSRTSNAILIRVPGLSDKKKRVIISFMKSYIGKDYNTSLLFKSIWNRISRRKFVELADIPEEDITRADLYCSSLIAVAFWLAKVPIKFAKHPLDVWPKDFLLNPYTEKICRYLKH